MYMEKFEKENKIESLTESFLRRHDEFDAVIKQEKTRILRVKRFFTVSEILVAACLLFGLSIYKVLFDVHGKKDVVLIYVATFCWF